MVKVINGNSKKYQQIRGHEASELEKTVAFTKEMIDENPRMINHDIAYHHPSESMGIKIEIEWARTKKGTIINLVENSKIYIYPKDRKIEIYNRHLLETAKDLAEKYSKVLGGKEYTIMNYSLTKKQEKERHDKQEKAAYEEHVRLCKEIKEHPERIR